MRFLSALTTGFCLLITLTAQPSHAMTLYFSDEIEDGQAYIIANDAMLKEEDATKIRRFLSAQAIKGVPTAIFITSPGGFGELMASYAKAILEPSGELFRRHKLFNIVIVNEECSSACVILMSHLTNGHNPRALKFMVDPLAKFGFHSPVDMRDGAVVSFKDQAEREVRIAIQLSLLANGGVNPDWLRRNETLLRDSKMTFLTGLQLCVDRAGIIPADSCVQGGGDLSTMARNQLKSALLANPVTRTMGIPLRLPPDHNKPILYKTPPPTIPSKPKPIGSRRANAQTLGGRPTPQPATPPARSMMQSLFGL